MSYQLAQIMQIAAALGALSGVAYALLSIWSAIAFQRREKSDAAWPPAGPPPVSILKPLKGIDPEMYESFRSHCLQDYPEYEILFGVSDPEDPAIALVERLRAEFPQRAIRLVVCRNNLGANTKVSNLAQMLPEARYEHLVVNDSDIRVPPDYLRRVIPPLCDAATGMVTCLYRAQAAPSFGSRLESLGVSTDFCAGVLVARQLEGIRFGLGSTLAFRRRDLQSIGGFEVLTDYLADDYQLGKRIAGLGLRIELAESIVETFLPAYSLREFFDHQLRWARSIRDSRRWGYVGMGLTFGLPWALLTVALSREAAWAWSLLLVSVIARLAMALVTGLWVLGDRQVLRWLALLPLRDVLALFVWFASFFGREIEWRGERFVLRDGKLLKKH